MKKVRTRTRWAFAKIVGDAMNAMAQPDAIEAFKRAAIDKPCRLRPNNMRQKVFFQNRKDKWNAPPENTL